MRRSSCVQMRKDPLQPLDHPSCTISLSQSGRVCRIRMKFLHSNFLCLSLQELTCRQSETSEALKIALTAVGSVRLHYQAQPTARGLIIAHDISKKARTEVLSLLKPVMESNQELEQVELDTALAALLSCVVAGVSWSVVVSPFSWPRLRNCRDCLC